jgi:hypothetical protein
MGNLARFSIKTSNPDVLTCIANLSSDEVFTPPDFANEMLNTLEQAWANAHDGASIWSDSKVTFLDPCTKSGVFLREVVERLTKGLEDEIPDLQSRVEHILTKQVFGIGITNITSLLARRSVYCSKLANGDHSVASSFDDADGNIWFQSVNHTWVGGNQSVETADEEGNPIQKKINGRCRYCGASQIVYERESNLETHAYAFIHTSLIKSRVTEIFGEDMQFDVIIGNPPYQLSSGETSDTPIYHKFVEQAMNLEPRYLTMVTPSRWFTGGKGLDDYRQKMISDRRLNTIVDYPNSMETFPGVEIKGGVSYFLWTRDETGDCLFVNMSRGEKISAKYRDLRDGKGVIIRDNFASSIIEKVIEHSGPVLSDKVSPQTPFGIYTNFSDWHSRRSRGDVQLFKRGLEEAWISPEAVKTRHEWIPKIKVIMSYAYNGGDAIPHQVTGKPIVIPGNSVCTQTYMVAGVFDEVEEAERFASYLKTRFVRFLIRQRKISQHNRPDTFAFVPDLPMDRDWTDEALFKRFGITQSEQQYIISQVKTMTEGDPIEDDVDAG